MYRHVTLRGKIAKKSKRILCQFHFHSCIIRFCYCVVFLRCRTERKISPTSFPLLCASVSRTCTQSDRAPTALWLVWSRRTLLGILSTSIRPASILWRTSSSKRLDGMQDRSSVPVKIFRLRISRRRCPFNCRRLSVPLSAPRDSRRNLRHPGSYVRLIVPSNPLPACSASFVKSSLLSLAGSAVKSTLPVNRCPWTKISCRSFGKAANSNEPVNRWLRNCIFLTVSGSNEIVSEPSIIVGPAQRIEEGLPSLRWNDSFCRRLETADGLQA